MRKTRVKSGLNNAVGEFNAPRVKNGVGRRIFEWRCEQNMPLWQLAQKSGMAYSKLFALETVEGEHIGRVLTVEKLAQTMGVNPAWLVGWSDCK